jgi:hypothetical protein
MDAITLTGVVDKNRQLLVTLPEDIPAGPVELVIRPLSDAAAATGQPTRELAQAMLRSAGLLNDTPSAPPDARPLTPEEAERLGRQLAGSRRSDELIDEDRGTV